jgi:YidC/Oxa1 family membrane protein insertase
MSGEQRRAIIAVVISGLILFGWQYFFAPTISVANNNIQKVEIDKNPPKVDDKLIDTVKAEVQKKTENKIIEVKGKELTYFITSDLIIKDILSNQTGKSFKDLFPAEDNNKVLFNFDGKFKSLNFNITEKTDREFIISNSEYDIRGTLSLDDLGYLKIDLSSSKDFKYRFSINETEEELEGGKYKKFVMYSDTLDSSNVGDTDKGDVELKWFGLDFYYHVFLISIDKRPLIFEMQESGKFTIQDAKQVKNLSFSYIFAKKEYDHLLGLGNNLESAVDFSFWSILAVPILRGLQFFFSLIPNWGVSIILLTILMRMLTFPLQYKSFKSMKKMQEIQPELTKIKEKYKEDPQRMQKETMALFKKAGTNPLGGCLPMILQMPIFFAFYRVLYSAVELVDAPFMLWITDLSSKDPYYVLPVLMGITMFFHQRLTPSTTMDPTQRKIMMFMPLIFAVFMKDFPAGLTLYIVVSTFVAMLQQLFVYRRN